jgi:DNA polymerase-3 subunit alpha (Gram-positive type)
MDQTLLETFEGLQMTQRQKALFQDVFVERVRLYKQERRVEVFLKSSHIIPYREICLVRHNIERVLGPAGFEVSVFDRYELSKQYRPRDFWEEYRDSMLEILKQENILDFNILFQGHAVIEENTLSIQCEDDLMYRAREQELIRKLKDIFREKANMEIEVEFCYTQPVKLTSPGDEYEYVRLESSPSRQPQQQETVSAQREKDNREVPWNSSEESLPKESFSSPSERDMEEAAAATAAASEADKSKSYGKGSWRKGGFRGSIDEDCFYGRNCEGDYIKIADIQGEINEVVIEGMITSSEAKETRNGKILFVFNMTDFTDTIAVKIFLEPEQFAEIEDPLKKGNFVVVKGMPLYDKYSHEICILSVRGIKPGKDHRVFRMDHYPGRKRVELHAHTQMSEMDSVMDVKSYVNTALKWGHKAIAITDHGVVQSFPDADHALKPGDDLKIIYGVEAYLVDDLIETVENDKGQNLQDSFVVFDLETTGIGAKNNEIIEIGAVKVVNQEIVDRFSTFVNPGRPIPYKIEQLTGIDDGMVQDSPDITEVLPRFLEFCRGCVMVAHNASFDMGFIRQKAVDQGIEEDFTVVDTVAMSRALLPQLGKHTLDNVAKNLGVSLDNHHRAVDDAQATAEIFLRLSKRLEDKGITTLHQLNEFGKPTEEIIRKLPSYHAIILAKNETGRVNLYRLVSESHLKYFNRRPKLPKSLLMEYREGLILGSACEAGELYRAILEGKTDDEIDRIVRFYDYLEIQPLGNDAFMIRDQDKYPQIQDENDLMEINRKIVALGDAYRKPVAATCDVHFLNPEDEVYRRIIMSGKGFADADQQAPLYYRTTEEMLSEFQYLGAAKAEEVVITNTNRIADMIEYIHPCSPRKCPPEIENSDQDLRDICYKKAYSMYGKDLPEIVTERLERELNSIISNGYAVMYIIAQKLVWKSVEDGYLVGSRGSVGSSFVATMAGISEINPLQAHYYCPKCHYYDFDSPEVKSFAGSSACDMPDRECPQCGEMLVKDGHDIPFETFLGFKGNKEPDIDLNFSSEYQSNAHDYTEVIFGAGQTFRAGTVGTMAEKTAYGYVKKYYEEHGETKRSAEIERIADGCVGVRRSTGQHPGGIVVLPMGEEIYTFTPVQHPANDMKTKIITTHFDYHKIDANLLKLDILGHQDPTMIRMLEDLTGVEAAKIRMDDKDVLSLFESTKALGIAPEDIGGCTLGSLGLPELGTHFVMNMLVQTKPKNFSDLVRISGLSHGTNVWQDNAEYFIANGYCTLSTAICTRDDIMTYLIRMGVENERSFKIMESVRKGKGLDEGMIADMKACDVPDWYIESCQRIKYMFPKAHAAAYIMMAMRVAWFKVHRPLAYYAAYFSIRATSFNYELMCLGKERLEHYMNDYNKRSDSLTDKEKSTLEDMKIVQEMYARGFHFVPIDIYRSQATRFQIVGESLMPSFSSIDGLGNVAAEMIEAEAQKGKFLSREDFKNRCKVSSTTVDTMAELGLLGDMPHTNQISLLDFDFS